MRLKATETVSLNLKELNLFYRETIQSIMESPLTKLIFKRCFPFMLFYSYSVKCGSKQGF